MEVLAKHTGQEGTCSMCKLPWQNTQIRRELINYAQVAMAKHTGQKGIWNFISYAQEGKNPTFYQVKAMNVLAKHTDQKGT